MRALFVTVASNELYVPVNAWRNSMGPVGHITYNAHGPNNDAAIIACAAGFSPNVIFYIGTHTGTGIPDPSTFKILRELAPCIMYQSDVEDEVWWDLLIKYRQKGCFDLIVSQTGVESDLVDMVSLMAIDIDAFSGDANKDLFCGFTGSAQDPSSYTPGVDPFDGRADVLCRLGDQIHFRQRASVGDYKDYVKFTKRLKINLNISLTGSGKRHHVKWRVLEAAFSDSALLEMKESPTSLWFPEGSYLTYSSVSEAMRILASIKGSEIIEIASKFSAYAREHYTPTKIFNNILGELPK